MTNDTTRCIVARTKRTQFVNVSPHPVDNQSFRRNAREYNVESLRFETCAKRSVTAWGRAEDVDICFH